MGNCAEGAKASCVKGAVSLLQKPEKRTFKVCVCGGSTKIGKPLCLLLALDPRVAELSVQDLAITSPAPEAVAEDLQLLGRPCRIRAYALDAVQRPVDHLEECLTGCDLVIACAGWPSNGRCGSDLLKLNGGVAKNVVEACARYCPNAVVGLIMNPLNSLVPAMATLYEKAGLDPLKICGITSLDVVRANKFLHVSTGTPIEDVSVAVVGGHSGRTAVPVFSHDRAGASVEPETLDRLMRQVQGGSDAVTKAMKDKSGASLSQAYACMRFAQAVLSGLGGRRTDECCLVKSKRCDGLDFFASRVTFGPTGVEEVHPVGQLAKQEKAYFDEARKLLAVEVAAGLKYAETLELSGSGSLGASRSGV